MVTAAQIQVGGCVYVEDVSMAAGIIIDSISPAAIGDVISATGTFGKSSDDEVGVHSALVKKVSHVDPVSALGLSIESLGGSLRLQNSISEAYGLDNTGLLVRV